MVILNYYFTICSLISTLIHILIAHYVKKNFHHHSLDQIVKQVIVIYFQCKHLLYLFQLLNIYILPEGSLLTLISILLILKPSIFLIADFAEYGVSNAINANPKHFPLLGSLLTSIKDISPNVQKRFFKSYSYIFAKIPVKPVT